MRTGHWKRTREAKEYDNVFRNSEIRAVPELVNLPQQVYPRRCRSTTRREGPRLPNHYRSRSVSGWLMQISTSAANVDLVPVERPETPPAPSCRVPFRHDDDFVERGNLLYQVEEKCAQAAARVALVGIGGVG
jgi:hypothetical protein